MRTINAKLIKEVSGGRFGPWGWTAFAVYKAVDSWNSHSGFGDPMSYPGTYRGSELHYYSDPLL